MSQRNWLAGVTRSLSHYWAAPYGREPFENSLKNRDRGVRPGTEMTWMRCGWLRDKLPKWSQGAEEPESPVVNEGSTRLSVELMSMDGKRTQSSRLISVTGQQIPVQNQLRYLWLKAIYAVLSKSADPLCSFVTCITFPHWSPILQLSSCLPANFWLLRDGWCPWLSQFRLPSSRK